MREEKPRSSGVGEFAFDLVVSTEMTYEWASGLVVVLPESRGWGTSTRRSAVVFRGRTTSRCVASLSIGVWRAVRRPCRVLTVEERARVNINITRLATRPYPRLLALLLRRRVATLGQVVPAPAPPHLARKRKTRPAPTVPEAGPLPAAVTEEELMGSGHELPEGYTCPLCCLPMALPVAKHSSFKSCCMKTVCDGCSLASRQRGMGKMCPFCRAPTPDSDAATPATLARVQKRVDAKDPMAIEFLAGAYYSGDRGLQQDIPRAIELWTKAACLGDLDAHYRLGYRYYHGEGVEKDMGSRTRRPVETPSSPSSESTRNAASLPPLLCSSLPDPPPAVPPSSSSIQAG
ncbi:hypothetical protein THAOC_25470 [Thalassiosira oceanica]|uniref:RING-type domain-containing protein n=1 Tax=Thalassiosira oceanica TaxID=159749 RepID=K0RP57_THAOC|nr:hypothetical protein THAOC_25470 [Thalassiosira oceanica]|eukprot:EJK54865.1 hypothetical protein THAOC_25470 [Thalassiosira oceanica]